jgi:hypothetical protein
VGTGDSPQLTGIELGHASDTTITRASAGEITVEGNRIFRAGGTDIPVADGGSGASSLTDGGVLLGSGTAAITAMAVLANSEMIVGDGTGDPVAESGATLRTSIGVAIGSDVQAFGAVLDDFNTLDAASSDGEIIVATGAGAFAYESGATLRTSVGVGTGDSPQLTGIELGHATDTTIARSGSGDITIEGNAVYRAGGTDVSVADGGTGASTLTDGGVLLGSGTGAITATAVLADSEMLVGDGTTDPAIESGATLRTSIGVGTGDSPQLTGIELGHASDTTITRPSSGNLSIEGNLVYRAGGTDIPVADGGTGASNAADARTNLGISAGGYVSGDTPDFDALLLRGQKIQCFVLQFKNNSGTIQHQIIDDIPHATTAAFSDKIIGASNSYANTTVIDSSTAMTSGMGLLSGNPSNITFDTAAQTTANLIGIATLERRSVGADMTVETEFVSRNINGVTRVRLQMDLYTNAGAAFSINTTNIALNKYLAIRFTGYLA